MVRMLYQSEKVVNFNKTNMHMNFVNFEKIMVLSFGMSFSISWMDFANLMMYIYVKMDFQFNGTGFNLIMFKELLL